MEIQKGNEESILKWKEWSTVSKVAENLLK